jgi:hypothetical protein
MRKNEQLLKLHRNVSTDKMQGKRRFDKGRSFPYNHLFLVVETCHVITISKKHFTNRHQLIYHPFPVLENWMRDR